MPESNSTHQTAIQELTASANVPSNQRTIEEITTKILLQKGQIVQSFLEIGNLLIEAKEQLTKHGEWLKWLSTSVDISERMAQRYMQVAQSFSNTTSVTDLGMTKALALLALPESKRESFIGESHEINGEQKRVSEMSTRELKKAIRKQNDADDLLTFKKIYRKDKTKSLSESSNLCDPTTDLESAQKHMDCILSILGSQTERVDLQDKLANGLRCLHETVLKCLDLAQVELPNDVGGIDHANQ